MEDVEEQIKRLMEAVYRDARPEYQGYSAKEIDAMENDPFGPTCPVKLNALSQEEYLEIPIVSQIKCFLKMVGEQGQIRLTAKGRLPIKEVKILYNHGYIKHHFIEAGYVKTFREDYIPPVYFTRIFTLKAGLVKKRSNKLSLTAKALKALDDNELLFKTILETFLGKYTWTEMDSYLDRSIGRYGFIYSLALLGKYGQQPRSKQSYAENYFEAFPELLLEPLESEWLLRGAYTYRTFEIFTSYLGVAEVFRQPLSTPDLVKATPLFSKLLTVLPHQQD